MSYWEDRQNKTLEAVMSNAHAASNDIAKVYSNASFYLNDKIQGLFDRYVTKRDLSVAEAKRLLNEVSSDNIYNDMLKKLKTLKGKEKEELLKKLEAPAYRHRISRLEELNKQLDHMMQNIYNQEKDISTASYIESAHDSYYRTTYNLQKGIGVEYGFAQVDHKKLDRILNDKWSGANYSERIWNNTQRLGNELKNKLALGFIVGMSEKEMIQELSELFQVNNFIARRLVETESVYVSTMMDIEAFKEADVEVMKFVATHDLRTSKICREHDSKLVKVSKAVPGVNVPPLHPHCRSFMIPVIDDELNKKLQRRNKNEDGSYEIVDANETYEQWYERKVNSDYDGTVEVNHKRRVNVISDKEQYERYKRVLGDEYIPDTFEKFQDMKYNNLEKWSLFKRKYRVVNSYESNSSLEMSSDKVFYLDYQAIKTKKEMFTGKLKSNGNIAVMEFDGEIYYSHRRVNFVKQTGYQNFKGDKNKLILLSENPIFETSIIDDIDRLTDSEAKLFEFAALLSKDGKEHELYLLSELSSCKSCKDVMKQFEEMFPNVKVYMTSTKEERMNSMKGKVWKYRWKKKSI